MFYNNRVKSCLILLQKCGYCGIMLPPLEDTVCDIVVVFCIGSPLNVNLYAKCPAIAVYVDPKNNSLRGCFRFVRCLGLPLPGHGMAVLAFDSATLSYMTAPIMALQIVACFQTQVLVCFDLCYFFVGTYGSSTRGHVHYQGLTDVLISVRHWP